MPNIGHELDGYDIIHRNPLETSPILDPEFLQIGSNEMIQDFPFDNNLGTNWDRYCTGDFIREFTHVHQCKDRGLGKCCAEGKDGNPSIGVTWNKKENPGKSGYCGNCYNGPAKTIKP